VVDTVLEDQLARGESVHAGAGILAGLAGVITTLAGTSSTLPHHVPGQLGMTAAGAAAVLAVTVLLVRRPGRQPVDLEHFVDQILRRSEVELTEDVLLTVDLGAASRNEGRLRAKGVLIVLSALALAVAVIALVAGSIGAGTR
jgi:hypothetical protein